MNFIFNLTGANTPIIKEYDIASDTEVYAGEVAAIDGGIVTKAENGKEILGIFAEDHSGKPDILNARSNGTKIRVNITDGAVYNAKAPEYIAKAGGSSTTLVTDVTGLSVSVNSGYAVLTRKADGSANTDNVGTKRLITGVSVSGSTATVTISDGGVPSEGDTYMLIPFVGDTVYANEKANGICFYNSASCAQFKCVCADENTGMIGVKLTNTVLA